MSGAGTRAFLTGADGLPEPVRAELAAGFALRDLPPGEGDVEVWDTFDGRIWAAGHLLLARGDRWDFGAREAAWEPVLAERSGGERFAADFDDRLRVLLAPLLGVRAVLRHAGFAWTRRTTELLNGDEKIVCRIDWEQWIPVERGGPLRLLVLRPLRGYDVEADAARAVLERGATPLAGIDPLPYVVGRLMDGSPAGLGVSHLAIGANDPARHAVSQMAAEMIRRARRCEAGICEDLDAEFLHDFRVHLRKARSVLALLDGVFSPETTHRLKAVLGDVARRTNRLRDDDVHLARRAEFEGWLPPELRAGLAPVFAAWSEERVAEQTVVARYLRSAEYAGAMAEVERVLEHPETEGPAARALVPVGPLILQALARRYRRIVRLAREMDHETPDEVIHELRIHGKKLRYLLEFTRDFLPAADRAPLEEPLRQLQNRLGAFNDSSVQRRALLARAGAAGPDSARLLAIGGLVALLHERQTIERGKILARLETVCAKDTRRWVRERFAAAEGSAS